MGDGNSAVLEELVKGKATGGDIPMAIVASSDYATVYDIRQGEPTYGQSSRILAKALDKQLAKVDGKGRRVFSTIKPEPLESTRKTYCCLLHKDAPDREKWDELGLPTCSKSNLASPMQVELHMRHRHKVEYETIERERKHREEAEEREFKRLLYKSASRQEAVEEAAPLYVKDPKKK